LSALNQTPRSENASIIAEAERALIGAGIDDIALPKRRGSIPPARLLEKFAGGAAIKTMHRRRAEIEERSGHRDPLPEPHVFDAEWWIGPAGRTLLVVFALVCVGSTAATLLRFASGS
jgi:hypothetical protein